MGLYVFTSKQSDVRHIILYQMHLAEKGPMIAGRRDIYQDQLIDYKPRVVSLALCQKKIVKNLLTKYKVKREQTQV